MNNYPYYKIHLYYIEKIKDGYIATCLFWGEIERFNKIDDIPPRITVDSIWQENIKKEHNLEISYGEIKNFVEELIYKDPKISNKEIKRKLKLFLYNINLNSLMQLKLKYQNIISQAYFNNKIDKLEEEIKQYKK